MDPTIATILGAIMGALLSGPVTYYFTKKLAGIQRFDTATARLRAAFAPALARIKLAREDDHHVICNILNELVPGHAAAIEEFRPFVPKGDRDKYQKAWEDYYQTAMQGAPYATGQAFKQEITLAAFFEKKIHDILAFIEK